jgi:copper(I)-binding protein
MKTRKLLFAAWLLPALLGSQFALAAVEASDGWSRETPPGTQVAVGYFTLKNTGAGRVELLKITSPVAKAISFHQTSIDANGVSKMWPVGRIELSPGEILRFEPNGKHIMLEGLAGVLRAGTRVPVTLVFQGESPITVQLEVRPLVDEHAGHDMHHEHHH